MRTREESKKTRAQEESDCGEYVCAAKESKKSDSLTTEKSIMGIDEVYVSQVARWVPYRGGAPWSTMGLLMEG